MPGLLWRAARRRAGMRAAARGGGGARAPSASSASCCRQSRLVWTGGVGRATKVIDRQRRGWVWPAASSRRGSWDPGRPESAARARAVCMPVRRWTEAAPRIATTVVKATACALSRTGRSAGAVSCFSVSRFEKSRARPGGGGGGGGGRMHRLRHHQPATALTVIMAFHHRSVES